MSRGLKLLLFIVYCLALRQLIIFFIAENRKPKLYIEEKFGFLKSHNNIPNFSEINCDQLAKGNVTKAVLETAKKWEYKMIDERFFLKNMDKSQRCKNIISYFGFNTKPLSVEEKEYPLAYGLLVYKWIDELYYTMSAIYQPQNVYCIGVDQKSSEEYKNGVGYLQECFPNIHIAPPIKYCGFSIISAVHKCLSHLTSLNHNWKYYQYLTGFDLPLRTNREMVRVFKQLNESFNGEVSRFQTERLKSKNITEVPNGITLFKSSLSATFSRKTAEYLAKAKPALDYLNFLNGTSCPDESFWTSMLGNKGVLDVPGSFNGTEFLRIINKYKKNERKREDPSALPYYISRYQLWVTSRWKACAGKFVSGSCVFGVGDIAMLMQRPHLVAHKFYLNFEPAAYFCVYQKVRERSSQNIEEFDAKRYGYLPGPRLSRGESVERWFINRKS